MNAEYWQRLVRILTQGDLPVKEEGGAFEKGPKISRVGQSFWLLKNQKNMEC